MTVDKLIELLEPHRGAYVYAITDAMDWNIVKVVASDEQNSVKLYLDEAPELAGDLAD